MGQLIERKLQITPTSWWQGRGGPVLVFKVYCNLTNKKQSHDSHTPPSQNFCRKNPSQDNFCQICFSHISIEVPLPKKRKTYKSSLKASDDTTTSPLHFQKTHHLSFHLFFQPACVIFDWRLHPLWSFQNSITMNANPRTAKQVKSGDTRWRLKGGRSGVALFLLEELHEWFQSSDSAFELQVTRPFLRRYLLKTGGLDRDIAIRQSRWSCRMIIPRK